MSGAILERLRPWLFAARRAAALLFLAAPLFGGGTITYVARETVEDPGLAARLAATGGAEARRLVVALSEETTLPGVDLCIAPGSVEQADDPDLARRFDAADVLVLRGGSFSAWYRTAYPPGRRSHLAQALQDFLEAEKPIVAHGGACRFLSGGVPEPWEELERWLDAKRRNPRRRDSHEARVALGVGPRALFDAGDWGAGAPARLLDALHRTRVDPGFLFVGEVALEFSRERGELRVLGPGEVLVLDLDRARRGKRSVDGARLSRLLEGDRWEFAHRRPVVDGTREGQCPTPSGEAAAAARETELTSPALSSWLLEQAADPRRQRRIVAAGRRWSLGWDSASALHGEGAKASVTRVPFECRW